MDAQQITEMVRRVMREEASSSSSYAASPAPCCSVTLKTAEELIARVMERAEEIGVRAVCAVVSSGARPVAVKCADGSYIASYDIALGKAYTSAALQMKTSALGKLAAPGGPLYGIEHTNNGKIVIFGGGIPLILRGRLIGGFGVSGGTEEQDSCLGDFAEQVFSELAASL